MEDKKKRIMMCFFYLIIFALVASAAVLIWPVYRQYEKQEAELLKIKEFAAQKNAECMQLNKTVQALESSPRAIEKVAREKFGLCRDGETIMRYPQESH